MLRLWTVYDHPTDYPDKFVARLWEISRDGPRPTDSIVIADTLELVREQMLEMNLICLSRHQMDDPKIVEVWL